MNIQKKWFTLVELIVVITILAILWTIAFLSFQWYSRQARDSVRISNYSNINTTLEVYEVRAWKYPKPENTDTISYAGVNIWQQWVIWERIQSLLRIAWDLNDTKFGSEISYSVTTSWKDYEIAWLFEWSELTQNVTNQTYASTDVIAYVWWSYNSKYLKTSTGWETHIISIPSLILNTRWVDQEIQVWVQSNNFVIGNKKTIPWSFIWWDFNSEEIVFTSRLLYQWTDCSPLNEMAYYNLEVGLKQSYWTGTFQTIEKYDQYQTWYIHPFYLEENALLLGKELRCSSNPIFLKSDEVLPLSCVNEDGTFEWFSSWDLISDSCLHTYEWDSDWIVENWSWNWGWNAVRNIPALGGNKTTSLIYNMVLNKTANLKFDYKLDFDYWEVTFYINWVKYEKWGYETWGITNGVGAYQTYTTSLLPPWQYEFKFEAYTKSPPNAYANLYIDNIVIDETCIDGWPTCGWTLWFEDGSTNPYDLFSFSWVSTTPWTRITDSSEWTYALKNPILGQNESTYLTYEKTLTQTGALNFDYKLSQSTAIVYFSINWATDDSWWYSKSYTWSTNYQSYTTSSLPPWTYQFQFQVRTLSYSNPYANFYLDNITITP